MGDAYQRRAQMYLAWVLIVDEKRRVVYEVRGKLQTQMLCGADDNPRQRMDTAR